MFQRSGISYILKFQLEFRLHLHSFMHLSLRQLPLGTPTLPHIVWLLRHSFEKWVKTSMTL
jgi:hypothetical protein